MGHNRQREIVGVVTGVGKLISVSLCISYKPKRIAPMLHFEYKRVAVKVHGIRQESPSKMHRIDYTIEVDSDENEGKLELHA